MLASVLLNDTHFVRFLILICFVRIVTLTPPTTQGYTPMVKVQCRMNDMVLSNRKFGSRVEKLFQMGMDNNDPSTDDRWPQSPATTTTDSDDWMSHDDAEILSPEQSDRRNLAMNLVAGALLVASGIASSQLFLTNVYTPTGFRRLSPIQFIAALGDPKASSGTFDPLSTSTSWGLWTKDPGPRGVWLRDYPTVLESQVPSLAPAGWTFDGNDWWLEEHGIIMEQPMFPIKPGRYLVTGGRSLTTGLTIDKDGNWMLDEGTLYDVTHLPCRSARYRPLNGVDASPKQAHLNDFPVRPGAAMPTVPGYSKQDYAVLFLVGVANVL